MANSHTGYAVKYLKDMRMDFITRYLGCFKQKTLRPMLLALLQLSLICVSVLALARNYNGTEFNLIDKRENLTTMWHT